MNTHTELFAIVRQSDNRIIWAKVCTPEYAQKTAVIAAMGGNMQLLSGADLAAHLEAVPATNTVPA